MHWLNCSISNKYYEHVLNVWKAFKMNSMKDYYDSNLKVVVLWLACMFGTFRKESINSLELDPAHYLSTPGYSWDAILRLKGVNLKLISDIEKYQIVESTARGGVYMICKGYAQVNNKFLKSYSANKSTSLTIQINTNNLYGYSMMQLLPTKILYWVSSKDLNSPKGCFVDVNFDYPH